MLRIRKLFCGLPNQTSSTIIGILEIIFGMILCAAYGTALQVTWDGKLGGHELLTRPQVEQDFISTLGVRNTSVLFARTYVVAFLCFSFVKIIQGIILIISISKASLVSLRIWLLFKIVGFIAQVTVFILLFTFGTCKPALIFIHSLTFAVGFFCIMIVTMVVCELSQKASTASHLARDEDFEKMFVETS